jgi:hypothetical protein
MNRDSKGRFCSNKKYSEVHKTLMETIEHGNSGSLEDPFVDWLDDDEEYFKNIKNDNTEEGSRYTVGVKVVAFYDVEVRANSEKEALDKISDMSSYKLLTENVPVDSRDPVFSWLALQDE